MIELAQLKPTSLEGFGLSRDQIQRWGQELLDCIHSPAKGMTSSLAGTGHHAGPDLWTTICLSTVSLPDLAKQLNQSQWSLERLIENRAQQHPASFPWEKFGVTPALVEELKRHHKVDIGIKNLRNALLPTFPDLTYLTLKLALAKQSGSNTPSL
jgi:hypothetical protein